MIKNYVLPFFLVGVRVAACILCFTYTVAEIYSFFLDLAASEFGAQIGVQDYMLADIATLFTAALYFLVYLMTKWITELLVEVTNDKKAKAQDQAQVQASDKNVLKV